MLTRHSIFETHARGKLLLTGEYFVLDGAKALAIPARYGQSLLVRTGDQTDELIWTSKDADDSTWFEAEFSLPDIDIRTATDARTAQTLADILRACQKQQPDFLQAASGWQVSTRVDFPRNWGLGTSSTLIAAVAKWAGVDPYRLLSDTLGGSGYDIACAYAGGPLIYQRTGAAALVQEIYWQPLFSEQMYFVHLGRKQDSRKGIARYRDSMSANHALIREVSRLTERFIKAGNLETLDEIITVHETLIGSAIGLPRAKDLYFSDFWGEVKSLGAWGGDFVLATSHRSEADTRAYFAGKGFDTFLSWRDMAY